MLYTEWNWDDALAVREEEGIEKGIEKGREEVQNMVLELVEKGCTPEQIRAELTALKTTDAGTAVGRS